MGRLHTLRWNAPLIRAPGHHLGACISRARDAFVWSAHVSRQMHVYELMLRPAAVFAVDLLCNIELFKCLSCDWSITDVVHVHRSLNMYRVQFVIYLNGTKSTLE